MFQRLKRAVNRKIIGNLSFYLQQLRWALGVAWRVTPRTVFMIGVLSALTSFIPAIQVIVAREIINVAIDVMDAQAETQQLYWWVIIGLAVTIIQTLSFSGKSYANRLLTARLSIDLSIQVLEKAALMEFSFFEDPRYQDLMERASRNPAGSVTSLLTSAQSSIVKTIQSISFVGVLIALAPSFAALLVALFIPYGWFEWTLSRQNYTKEFLRTTKRRWNRYFASRLTNRSNIPEIKFLDLASYLIDKYRDISEEFFGEDRRLFAREFIGQTSFAVLSAAVIYLMLLNVVNRVVNGVLTVGDIALFTGAAFRLRDVVESSVSSVSDSWQNVLYVSDTTAFLHHEVEDRATGDHPLTALTGTIRFEQVSFAYPGTNELVLRDLSFEIRPREALAIVGPNGAGKSTLANLLARLYVPSSGRITLDGTDIQSYSLEDYYQRLAVVSQTFNRYEGTVIENIGYGDWRRLLDDAQAIQTIAEQADMHEMIEAMPERYGTLLGRMFGTYDLSRGQWQKLALLRAFAHGGDLLILDEPTASLDAQTEYNLYLKFTELAAGRTTVLISHRLSTINMADRIIVLKDGGIIESGTHEELMSLHDGYYAGLFHLHTTQLGV